MRRELRTTPADAGRRQWRGVSALPVGGRGAAALQLRDRKLQRAVGKPLQLTLDSRRPVGRHHPIRTTRALRTYPVNNGNQPPRVAGPGVREVACEVDGGARRHRRRRDAEAILLSVGRDVALRQRGRGILIDGHVHGRLTAPGGHEGPVSSMWSLTDTHAAARRVGTPQGCGDKSPAACIPSSRHD